MSFLKTQIGDIAYNPATGAFEALISFHDANGAARIPATYSAPVTADFTSVSNGLLQSALRSRSRKHGLRSYSKAEVTAPPVCAA